MKSQPFVEQEICMDSSRASLSAPTREIVPRNRIGETLKIRCSLELTFIVRASLIVQARIGCKDSQQSAPVFRNSETTSHICRYYLP
jgi:hypothetical protein